MAWQAAWEVRRDHYQPGSNPLAWRTGWARYDPELIVPSDWPAGRGAWTRYAAERLDRVIERARAGEVGWIDAG